MSFKNEILERIKNGTCEVLGLGVSNLPLCRWLKSKGAKVVGRDMKDISDIPAAGELSSLGIKLVTGEGYLEGIGAEGPERTVIFRAPGMRPDIPQISKAVERGALLTSEMELFFELSPATVIGITGSDGKTTTTTLVGKILEKENEGTDRRVYVGGNIGQPLLPIVDKMTSNDFAVVELSSFQLMTMKKSPHRAIITNITPNHLNWHTDMEEYDRAKQNICRGADCSRLVLNAENDRTAAIASSTDKSVALFSSKKRPEGEAAYIKDGAITYFDGEREERIVNVSDIVIPGMHNVENYMAAILVTRGLASNESVRHVATTFSGVEHRCELVRVKDGVRYYNSSIDSSPTRTAAALSNFKEKPIAICGGYDKNIPFEPLAKTLCERAKLVVLTGATAEKIKAAIIACPEYEKSGLAIIEKKDFCEAVLAAVNAAEPGDTVILSPACASFDAFANFEARGKKFKEIISSL